MPETRRTSFAALSVYPLVGISMSTLETNGRFYFSTSSRADALKVDWLCQTYEKPNSVKTFLQCLTISFFKTRLLHFSQ